MTDFDDTMSVRIVADTRELEAAIERAGAQGINFGRIMTGALSEVAVKGRGLGEVFRSLALSISKMALSAALKPVEQGINSVLGNILSGGVGFAKGGVVVQAMPVPFASGGVIASPISFPLGNGRTGIAGERGAEAIMPLARGPDGRLGVRAQAAAAPAITINIATPDAESFRRSETQIAAMLARAVGQGQRNL